MRTMNDFSEIEYGHGELDACLLNPERKVRFIDALDGLGANTAQEVLSHYRDWWRAMHTGTYIACFSEHGDGQEDYLGRLSMWRGYGNKTPSVALIFRPPTPDSADALNVFMEPVLYNTLPMPLSIDKPNPESKLTKEIDLVIANIVTNRDYLAGLERKDLLRLLHLPLMFSALTVKHPAFLEEREWRLVYAPYLYHSKHVIECIQTIAGVPQLVQELKLENHPEDAINGISFLNLFDRAIIGPSDHAWSIRDAIVSALATSGIEDAEKKVMCSEIPLR